MILQNAVCVAAKPQNHRTVGLFIKQQSQCQKQLQRLISEYYLLSKTNGEQKNKNKTKSFICMKPNISGEITKTGSPRVILYYTTFLHDTHNTQTKHRFLPRFVKSCLNSSHDWLKLPLGLYYNRYTDMFILFII